MDKHFSVMIKPTSSLCNLKCQYCFYADVSSKRDTKSYGLMDDNTAHRVIHNIFCDLPDGSSVSIGFQGGEPTLAGLDFFKDFVDTVNAARGSIRVDFNIQTNGLLLDEDWCLFLQKNNFLVGLSLDGDAELHNQNRIDGDGKGSFSRVMNAKALLEKHRVEYNVLTVLTNHLARFPRRVWNFLLAQRIGYVQFIPCLGELDRPTPSPYELTPERFASFYSGLFGCWADALRAGNYVSVKLFDDLFNLILKHR